MTQVQEYSRIIFFYLSYFPIHPLLLYLYKKNIIFNFFNKTIIISPSSILNFITDSINNNIKLMNYEEIICLVSVIPNTSDFDSRNT